MTDEQIQQDYARKPVPFLISWGIPIVLLISVNFLEAFLSATQIILIIAGSYAWMGVGCVINAMRCGRLHCYLSGPVMLLGAALILLAGLQVIDLGPVKVQHISYTTLLLVLLSFVLEWIWGSYAGRSKN